MFFYYIVKSLDSVIKKERVKKYEVLAGVCAAIGLLVWHIQIFYYTVWLFFVFVITLKKRDDKDFIKNLLLSTFFIFAFPIILATVFRILSPITTEQGLLRFDFFSFFQPLYILLLLLPLIYLYFFFESNDKKRFVFYSVIFLIFVLSLILMITPLMSAFKVIKVFFLKEEPYLTNIQEYKPLFNKKHFIYDGLTTVKNYFYFLFFFVPVLFSLFYIIKFFVKKELTRQSLLRFPLYLLFFSTSTLYFYQKRWGVESSYGLAYAHASLIIILWEGLKKICKKNYIPYGLMFFYLATFYYLPVTGTARLIFNPFIPIEPDLYLTLKWIKEQTPKTSYYLEPYQKPEYGIITPWDIGHLTLYYGERPVSANNFGHSLRGQGFKDSMAIWQTKDDKELVRICERNNTKFIILKDPLGYMTGLENMKFFYDYPAMRLMEYDGSFSPFGPALEHFRLVYESFKRSENTYHLTDVRNYKIYEYVRGVQVKGKTYPNEAINVSCSFRSEKGREFKWSLRAFSDDKGNFSFYIPYATKDVKYPVRAQSKFMATSKNKTISFDVSEKDVQTGGTILLNFI